MPYLGAGSGDYPHLPDVPVEQKDPYYPYDIPELKRNFQEPVSTYNLTTCDDDRWIGFSFPLFQVHAEIDFYDETRVGTPAPLLIPIAHQYAIFISVMVGFWVLYVWLEDKKMFCPVVPKQYPDKGKAHYTFEPKS